MPTTSSSVPPHPEPYHASSTYSDYTISWAPVTSTNAAGSVVTTVSASWAAPYSARTGVYDGPYTSGEHGLSTGAIAAMGAAGVVVCIFLGLFLFCFISHMRQRRQHSKGARGPGDESGAYQSFEPGANKPYGKPTKDDKPIMMNDLASPMFREPGKQNFKP